MTAFFFRLNSIRFWSAHCTSASHRHRLIKQSALKLKWSGVLTRLCSHQLQSWTLVSPWTNGLGCKSPSNETPAALKLYLSSELTYQCVWGTLPWEHCLQPAGVLKTARRWWQRQKMKCPVLLIINMLLRVLPKYSAVPSTAGASTRWVEMNEVQIPSKLTGNVSTNIFLKVMQMLGQNILYIFKKCMF